jgi:CPA1 family monovalent cation:H+ antiporter
MPLLDCLAVLLVLAAFFAYANYRFLKLPTTIGLMALTLLASLLAVGVGHFYPPLEQSAREFVKQIDFNEAVLRGMLGFLLFAGALHLDLNDLSRQGLTIAALATVGVVISTGVVAGLSWLLLTALGAQMPFTHCLLFGALISPTDPIAVIGLLKRLGAPKDLEVTIAGESLFNDGVGVVLFLGLLALTAHATGHTGQDIANAGLGEQVQFFALLFLREALGGAALGLVAGYLTYLLLLDVDNYQVEILLSLALVAGGYSLASALHVSGPIAMVMAGLLIGNHGRAFAMSPQTVQRLDLFWELIDEVLNAVLFVLLGLEVLALTFTAQYLAAGLLAVPIVLLARVVSVALPISLLPGRGLPVNTARLLVWGGLRGAISVAMALSLPRALGAERDLLLVMTYVVVVFSVLVQGLTVGPLARRWLTATPTEEKPPADGPQPQPTEQGH